MARVGSALTLFVQFYDANFEPIAPDGVINIRVLMDGDESVLVASQVEATNVYSVIVTPTLPGVVLWRGETSDPDVSAPLTQWAAEVVLSANSMPTLAEITSALQMGGVTLVSPVIQSGQTMIVIVGDDYQSEDDRAFTWDVSELTIDFTGATFTWSIPNDERSVTLVADALTLELDAAYTETLTPDTYPFAIRAELDSGNVVTLIRGTMKVQTALSDDC